MEPAPKTFNWVKARAECSPQHIFTLLREVVDSDVKAMQAVAHAGSKFSLILLADTKFLVARERNLSGFLEGSTVIFELTDPRITVRSSRPDRQLFTANPTLGEAGHCRLEVDDEQLELWQVSRRALEALFFG